LRSVTIRDVVLRLHRWGGLSLGLIVSVICFSGAALLIVAPAQERRAEESARITPGAGLRASPSEMIAAARRAFPGRELRSAAFYSDGSHAAVMSFRDGSRVFVNPWTGRTFGAEEDATESSLVQRLHESLLLPGAFGKLVGLVTVGFVVLLLLGVCLWWPRKGSIKKALGVEVRRGWKRANYDLHNALGFYAAALLLVLGGTGIFLAYPRLGSFAARVGGSVFGNDARAGGGQVPTAPEVATDLPRVDRALAYAQRMFPEAVWVRMLQAPGRRPGLQLRVAADPSGNAARYHTLRVDAAGDIQSLTRFGEERLAVRMRRLVGQLHRGTGMGTFYRVSAFLACMIGGLLPFSGSLIWFPRWRRRRRRAG